MRTAVVTGASRGIGSEFVARLLEDGWKVYAGYRSEKHRLELIDSKNLVCHRLDVTNNESIRGFCKKITGNVDLLINNATTLLSTPPERAHITLLLPTVFLISFISLFF